MTGQNQGGGNVDLFDAYFRRADLDQDGRISGAEAVGFFQGSNLSKQVLAQRPVDIILRKRASGVWFPYTAIERLWYQLEELISCGHMIDQCKKLKKLIHGALLNHLNLLKVDSDDVLSSATS